MPIERIVQQLRAEHDRLDTAIKALTGVAGTKLMRTSGGRKKTMSVAARRRISIAQKARWAKRTSSSGQAGAPQLKRTMSAAARRKIAARTTGALGEGEGGEEIGAGSLRLGS